MHLALKTITHWQPNEWFDNFLYEYYFALGLSILMITCKFPSARKAPPKPYQQRIPKQIIRQKKRSTIAKTKAKRIHKINYIEVGLSLSESHFQFNSILCWCEMFVVPLRSPLRKHSDTQNAQVSVNARKHRSGPRGNAYQEVISGKQLFPQIQEEQSQLR